METSEVSVPAASFATGADAFLASQPFGKSNSHSPKESSLNTFQFVNFISNFLEKVAVAVGLPIDRRSGSRRDGGFDEWTANLVG